MPAPTPPVCTHDLGVGTTVCLRCRQEQRQVARARQQRLVGMGGMLAIALVGVYVVVASATNAVRAARHGRTTASAAPAPASPIVDAPAAAPARATPAVAPAIAGAPLAIVVAAGRTALADSMVVERTGNEATVHFDTQAARTRRRDKFEHVVRQTLPAVYGPRADSILAAIPEGALVTGGDLLHELTARGVHLELHDGWSLELWPETRPGRDGPLVVRYRTRVVKG